MEVKNTLIFMNKGDGGNSYAHNSFITQMITSMTKPALEETIRSLFLENSDFHTKPVLNVADLGCAAGPNTFSVISTVLSTVENISKELKFQKIPEIQFYLNDLHGNDFNTLFHGLYDFGENNKQVSVPYFVMGAPGSFHGRLFPKNCKDLIHSSYSVHWLTKVPKLTSEGGVPLNKGKIYLSTTSPRIVHDAYLAQFQNDFSTFLKCRSQEMVSNGRIMLTIHGKSTPNPATKESSHLWDMVSDAITEMVLQGLIDEEKLDSFDVPYYTPSSEELRDLVNMEGSFVIEHLEMLMLDNNDVWPHESRGQNVAEALAKNIRSFTESIIASQFGQNLMDELYDKLVRNVVADDMSKGPIKVTSIVIVLKKIV